MLSDSILDLGKWPNRKTYTFTFMRFPVGALPEVQNWIWTHFSHKVLCNYYFFLNGAFWSIFNKVKKWISHCIFKSCAEWFKGFFQARNFFFCQKACIYQSNSHGGSQSFDLTSHILSNYSYPLLEEGKEGREGRKMREGREGRAMMKGSKKRERAGRAGRWEGRDCRRTVRVGKEDGRGRNLSCTLRSGLHEIPTKIRTFPHRLENNHSCKWTSDKFPGMITYVLVWEPVSKQKRLLVLSQK